MSTVSPLETTVTVHTPGPADKRLAVLVPLDGTPQALTALPVARLIAELERADLHLLHISEPVVPVREFLLKLGLHAEDVRGSIVDLASGDPATEIIRLSEEHRCRYLVMCAHTGSPAAPGNLGPVAEEVIRAVPCPVVIVPPESRGQAWSLHQILLPYDGSPTTSAAAEPALDLANKSGASLTVLHVTEVGAQAPREPGSIAAPRYVDQAQHEWPTWVVEFVERFCHRTGAPQGLRVALAVGNVGAEILHTAQSSQASLIVLGWHGRWEGEHAQAVKSVLAEAPCPVLLLRVPDPPVPASAPTAARVEQAVSLSRNQFEAVILDLDGVITRTATTHARAWKQMFDEYLQYRQVEQMALFEPFDVARDYRQYVDGKPRYDGVRSFLISRDIRIPEGSVEDPPGYGTICGLGNRKDQLFLALLEQGSGVEVFDDAVEQVHHWRSLGLKRAVVSSSKNCEKVLRAAGLLDLFDVRVDGNTAEDMGLPGKPAPDTFVEAARRLGIHPSRCIVFEDADAGVQAGRSGRFGYVVGIARHESDMMGLHDAGAHAVVRDLRAVTIE